jgi:hypothetical protein
MDCAAVPAVWQLASCHKYVLLGLRKQEKSPRLGFDYKSLQVEFVTSQLLYPAQQKRKPYIFKIFFKHSRRILIPENLFVFFLSCVHTRTHTHAFTRSIATEIAHGRHVGLNNAENLRCGNKGEPKVTGMTLTQKVG